MIEPPTDFPVPSDKDAITSTHWTEPARPRDGEPIRRQPPPHRGSLVEETSAFRSDVVLFYDLHTLVWDADFAAACRDRAAVRADNLDTYCFRENTPYGDHYVTAAEPEHGDPAPDQRPDAAAFMAY